MEKNTRKREKVEKNTRKRQKVERNKRGKKSFAEVIRKANPRVVACAGCVHIQKDQKHTKG